LAFPVPTGRGHLRARDGEDRAWARWDLPGPRGRIVISHGYGEHGERYAHTAAWLNGRGWSVSALDHRGFGRSPGIRGDARGLGPFAEDFALFLEQERLPGLPLVLLGHSFGAVVALAALLAHPGAAEGLILSSPALVLRAFPRSVRLLRRLLLRLAPHLSLDLPNNKDLVCSDPSMVERYWADPLCHRRISAAFTEVFPEGYRLLLERADRLRLPMLLLEAGKDWVADPDAAAGLWARVPAQWMERHRLEGFLHEIFHDARRGEAQDLAGDWLDRHFGDRVRTPDRGRPDPGRPDPGNPGALPAMRE
jgi:alpha-beta hydrolase superfamily lysophospholipase